MPTASPSSLTVYDASSRLKGRTASGAKRPRTSGILDLHRTEPQTDECPIRTFLRSPLSQIALVPMTGTSCQLAGASSLASRRPSLFAAGVVGRACRPRPLTGSRLCLSSVLFALAVASDAMTVEMRGLQISGAFFAVVLAMVLLGPAPAARDRRRRRPSLRRRSPGGRLGRRSNDAAVWAVFPLVGGLMAESLGLDATNDTRLVLRASSFSSTWRRTSSTSCSSRSTTGRPTGFRSLVAAAGRST